LVAMKTVEYYLSKGFDKPMAEYFASGRKTITDVKPVKEYKLIITFDNNESRLYDMKPFIQKGTVFENISNESDFNRVYVDETHCIAWDIDPNVDSSEVWSNKIDLCPDGCYVDSVPI